VNDSKTADLMQSFYKNIKSGASKDQAMRKAKLDFIKTYDNMEVHPFYWSSFIAIGDMITIDPTSFTPSFAWIWIIAGLGLILGLGYIFFFKYRFKFQ
jgi:hypothetical protein